MKNDVWKMCVVGLMLASPIVCTADPDDAAAVAQAVKTAGDGAYVKMDLGSSITLTFSPSVTFGQSGGTVIVYLSGLSKSIRVSLASDWYQDFYDESGYNGAWQVWLPPGTWSSLTISGAPQFSDFVVYLDAVQILGTSQLGAYSGHTEPVTPFVTASDMIVGLIDMVHEINEAQGIPDGTANSLEAKLQNAVDALAEAKKNCNTAAANKLQAFINEVDAQRYNKITDDQADMLVGAAQAIIWTLPSQ